LEKTIYYVRHGESEVNLTKEFSYKLLDYPLTKKGRLQAQQTAEYFRNKSIQCIFSSPLKRAMETAKIIAKQLNLKIILVENFREINVGSLEQNGFSEENWKKYFEIKNEWLKGNLKISFPEGENYVQVLERMKKGFSKVLDYNYTDSIIVGHGGILVATIKDISTGFDITELSSGNCSITRLAIEQEKDLKIRVFSWSTTFHLSGEAADLVPGVPVLDKNIMD
jgi:probable phosphoglycerate mutase